MPLRSTSGDLPPRAGLSELPPWQNLGLAKSAPPCCSCRPAVRRAEGSRWTLGVLLGSCCSGNEPSAALWPALSACRAADGSEEARSRVSGCLSAAVRDCWPGCLAADCRTEDVKAICFLANGAPACKGTASSAKYSSGLPDCLIAPSVDTLQSEASENGSWSTHYGWLSFS